MYISSCTRAPCIIIIYCVSYVIYYLYCIIYICILYIYILYIFHIYIYFSTGGDPLLAATATADCAQARVRASIPRVRRTKSARN